MKKALAILMALALVTTVAFAEDAAKKMPAPTVTAGVKAEAEVGIASGNTVDTYKNGTAATTTDLASGTKTDAVGLKATKFVTTDWVNFDWSKMSIKVEGKFDAYRATADDYSYLKATTTWKDFFGFTIVDTYSRDNKRASKIDLTKAGVAATAKTYTDGNATLDMNSTNEITATYDKLKENGIKFVATYYTADVFGILNFNQTGTNLEKIFDGFKNVTFEYDNEEFYGKLKYKNAKSDGTQDTPQIDTAIFEAKKMFGVWSARLNDSAENKLRLQDLDDAGLGTDTDIDRSEYVIGQDKKIQYLESKYWNDSIQYKFGQGPRSGVTNADMTAMNVVNTLTPVKGLTLKVHTVVPSNSSVSVGDFLRGSKSLNSGEADNLLSNLSFDAKYDLDKVGTFNFGTMVQPDYKLSGNGTITIGALTTSSVRVEGNSRYFSSPATSTTGASQAALSYTAPASGFQKYWGTAYWVEAKLDKLLGEKNALLVGFDQQFGNYLDAKAFAKQFEAADYATKVVEIKTAEMSKSNIYAEGIYNINDSFKVSLGTLVSFGSGFDWKAASNSEKSFDDVNKTADIKAQKYLNSNYTEANVIAKTVYDIKPFQLQVKACYKLNDTIKNIYIKDTFVALDKNLADYSVASARPMLGYADKNTLTLGADLLATKKATLGISADYNLFLGLPSAGDLEKAAYTSATATQVASSDAEKKVIASSRDAIFGSGDFSPVALKVSYTYSY